MRVACSCSQESPARRGDSSIADGKAATKEPRKLGRISSVAGATNLLAREQVDRGVALPAALRVRAAYTVRDMCDEAWPSTKLVGLPWYYPALENRVPSTPQDKMSLVSASLVFALSFCDSAVLIL